MTCLHYLAQNRRRTRLLSQLRNRRSLSPFQAPAELAQFILAKMLIFTVHLTKLLMPYRHNISAFYCCDSQSTLKVSFALFQSNFKVISVLNERISTTRGTGTLCRQFRWCSPSLQPDFFSVKSIYRNEFFSLYHSHSSHAFQTSSLQAQDQTHRKPERTARDRLPFPPLPDSGFAEYIQFSSLMSRWTIL